MPASDTARAVLEHCLDAFARCGEVGSHLLAPREVLAQSGLLSHHPLIQQIGGYGLDDPGTSDHHILATRSPLTGRVLFLSHDGATRFIFDSGSRFLEAVREAHQRGIEVTDLHPEHLPLAEDLAALGALVRSLLEVQELHDVVVSVIPSLNLEDIDLLRRLAQEEDIFLGEAVGIAIERRPLPAPLPIAGLCAADGHPQVAWASARAVRRIRQLGQLTAFKAPRRAGR